MKSLEDGDVAEKWLRSLIQNDLEKIWEGLKGEARKDLKAGISNFKQEISLIKFPEMPLSEVDGSLFQAFR